MTTCRGQWMRREYTRQCHMQNTDHTAPPTPTPLSPCTPISCSQFLWKWDKRLRMRQEAMQVHIQYHVLHIHCCFHVEQAMPISADVCVFALHAPDSFSGTKPTEISASEMSMQWIAWSAGSILRLSRAANKKPRLSAEGILRLPEQPRLALQNRLSWHSLAGLLLPINLA